METLDLSSFPKPVKNDWLKTAEKQLKGEDPFVALAWESSGLSQLKPYYDSEDTQDLNHLTAFFKGLPSHRWKLYEKITVDDEKMANQKALSALAGGCDGIIFLTSKEFNEEVLIKTIDHTICEISIPTLIATEKIRGMNASNTISQSESDLNPADQISQIVKSLDERTKWINRYALPDFFVEIATIRALRFILNTEKNKGEVRIHTSIPRHESDEHQWFLNTTASLASILGGSYSIDMPTAIGDSRITRNTGNLIRVESGIERYEDQCGGSYLVESLTHQIIQQTQNNL